jgi:phosphoribosylanthranilate isomerase
MTKIKICGLFNDADIDYVNQALPEYIGFVFAPSKRQVSAERAAVLRARLDERIIPVGVFVDAPIKQIESLYRDGIFQIAQLHGHESSNYIAQLKTACPLPVIKAVAVTERKEFETGYNQLSSCHSMMTESPDYLLFDYKNPGSGKSFDWDLLADMADVADTTDVQQPYFLAGGINPDNITAALAYNPYCIDVSSGAETNGIKDFNKISKLVQLAHEHQLINDSDRPSRKTPVAQSVTQPVTQPVTQSTIEPST